MTFLCGIGRNSNGFSVFNGYGNDTGAVSGIKGYNVLIQRPKSLNGYVFCGHSCRDSLIPTCKGITFLCGRCRSNDCGCIILLNGSDFATAVGIEGNGVLIDGPSRLNGYVFGRHGCRDNLIPTCKEVAKLGGCYGSSYSCTEIQRDGSDFATTVGIKGNGVLIYGPSRRQGDVTLYNGCKIVCSFAKKPTCKSVACFLGIGNLSNGCTVTNGYGNDFGIVIGIKGYSVLVDFPKGLDSYALDRHSCGDFLIPTCKGVAFLGRSCGSGYSCAEIQHDGSDFATAIGIKGNGVLIDCPSCFQSDIALYSGCKVICGFAKKPTCKGIACLLGNGRSLYCRTVAYGCSGFFGAVVSIKGYGVCIESPLSLESHVCGNSRAKIISGLSCIPTCKGVTFLCGICGSSCFFSLFNLLTFNGRTTVSVKGYSIGLSKQHTACNRKNKNCNQKHC